MKVTQNTWQRTRARGASLSHLKRKRTEGVKATRSCIRYVALAGAVLLVMTFAWLPNKASADVVTLRVGMTGENVKSFQSKLVDLGYLTAADGVYGAQTAAAVKKFQKANSLTVDGVAGAQTQNRITIVSTKKMELGAIGSDVTALQKALNQAGYNAGLADGEFGEQTVAAVKKFQGDNKLAVDGIVGRATLTKLYAATSVSKVSVTKTLRRGNKGDEVKAMQALLKAKGYLKGEADGVFGGATESAVKEFQKASDLKQDGIAGKMTLSALNGEAYISDAAKTTGEKIVAIAKAQLGIPYVWAGSTPQGGFDCSGLVYYCYKQLGINLPRGGGGQMVTGTLIESVADALPGDIIYWPGHVGLYIGNNQFIHAPQTGEVVSIKAVGNNPKFRRIVQ